MKKWVLLISTVVTLSLLTATTHHAFSEIHPVQINVSIPLEGSSEFCSKINTCFIPIEVISFVGAKVTWTNNDFANAHTVTSGDVVVGSDGTFDSGILGPEQKFSYVFEDAGIFPYYCTIHPWKEGIIKISNQGPEHLRESQLPGGLEASSPSPSLVLDVEKLKQENLELKKQIHELQNEIKELRMLVQEQIKVINQWIVSR